MNAERRNKKLLLHQRLLHLHLRLQAIVSAHPSNRPGLLCNVLAERLLTISDGS